MGHLRPSVANPANALKHSFMAQAAITLVVTSLIGVTVANAAELQASGDAVNLSALQDLSEKRRAQATLEQEEVTRRAAQQGLTIRRVLANGAVIALDRFEDGMPVYVAGDNVNAAISTSTDDIHPGGDAGLALDGAGQIAGIWDGGRVRTTHQEMAGRVISGGDLASFSNHATHVAGTMIASGVRAQARGMAFNAQGIRSWDFISDTTEMIAQQMTADPVLVSNHSYSFISGWSFNAFDDNRWAWYGDLRRSSAEDAKFGKYSRESYSWDALAYDSPHYVMVSSAGNDRNDFGPAPGTQHWHFDSGWVLATDTHAPDGDAGGYDTIAGGQGNAKSVLTIGAVNDVIGGYSGPASVTLTSFSGFGPTDDGRIKPDLVANGASLLSSVATGDDHYSSFSGTSMSAPNTSGSILLLQQHAEDLYGTNLLSSTIRGLLIHTADEAGSDDGPDYRFGWGLLNARSAAELLSADAAGDGDHEIHERVLVNGTVDTFYLEHAAGADLKVTLAWTDRQPGGLIGPEVDTPNAVLNQDLDVRLIDPLGGVHLPWVLDPADRVRAASTGDSFRDPVEQILVPNAQAGLWRLEVTHKGYLTVREIQDYSLIISGGVTVPGAGTQVLFEESGIDVADTNSEFRFFDVPEGATALRIALSGGTGRASLSVREGRRPTNNAYDCSPGQIVAITDNNEVCVFAGPLSAGRYFVRIRGDSAAADMSLLATIGGTSEANTTPVAMFTAVQRTTNQTVDFDASASNDAEGPIASYDWDFGDGSTGAGEITAHSYASAGDYQVTLTVTDAAGESASATQTLSVQEISGGLVEAFRRENLNIEASKRPRFSVTIPPGAANLRFVLSGGTGNGDLYVRRTLKPTRSRYDCRSVMPGNQEVCVFDDNPGGYTYNIFVWARTAVSDTQLVVTYTTGQANEPPIARYTATQLGATTEVAFDASASTDSDGSLIAHEWDFGDGSSDSGVIVNHTYASSGTYTVVLTVTDDDMATAVQSSNVIVATEPSSTLSLQWGGSGSFLLLDWTGLEGPAVFVYRDGVKIKATGNDGRWRENAPVQNAFYEVCSRKTGDCTGAVNSGVPSD